MSRLWIVVLLALSLWPAPAQASPGAPGGERDAARGRGHDLAHEVLRSAGSLGLLRGLESRPADGDEGAGDPPPGPGRRRAAPALRLPAGRGPAWGVEPCAPHCERLPYHATAPPSRR